MPASLRGIESPFDSIEAQISRMNLSPTRFPRNRTVPVTNAAFRPRHSISDLETDEQNITPMRQELPSSNNSYVSPKPPSAHTFFRTHSSPSAIDTSPKASGQKINKPSPNCVVGADFARTETPKAQHRFAAANLTPVTSNTGILDASTRSNNVASRNGRLDEISVPDAHSLKNWRNQVIRPRQDDAADQQDERIQFQLGNTSNWLQQLSSDSDELSAPFTEYRRDSPVPSVQLNRQSSTARGPENMVPYQPARDVRLGSFGIVRNDANSIFHNSTNSQQGGQETSEHHNSGHTDISIPSIHLATELDSSTIGSLTTISADDIDSLMEDSSVITETLSYDARQWGCFPNLSVAKALAPQTLINSAAPFDNNKQKQHSARTPSHQSSRYMSPEKEREVFDWLHSLEVDKDNNDYVLEAASSKFLSGKINMEDEFIILEESVPELRSTMSYQTGTIPRANGSALSRAPITGGKAFAPLANSAPRRVQFVSAEQDSVPEYCGHQRRSSSAAVKGQKSVPSPVASAPRRVKVVAAGQGSIAEYCGKERKLIVQSQCKKRKKRPILRSCSGM